MRPRWGLGLALLAVAAAFLLPVPPSSARAVPLHDDDQTTCKRSWTAERCVDEHWKDWVQWSETNLTAWKRLLERATWKTDTNCQKVKGWALNVIALAEGSVSDGNRMYIYYGIPRADSTSRGGSSGVGLNNGTEDMIIINDTLDNVSGAPLKWWAFLHEVGHIGGLSADHSESFNAYSAQDCAELKNEEDDDDDDDDGGGGGGGTTWTPGETCTTETEWVEEWVPCSGNGGGGGGSSCIGNVCSLPGLEACLELVRTPVEVVTCS